MDTIEEMVQSLRTWPETVRKYKSKGVKIIGYTGRFVPEELIYASGAIPHLMCRGGEPGPPEAVLPYMLRFMSPFARAQIGYHLLGLDPVVPLADLIVAQCDDCHMARLADLLEYFELPTMKIGIPPDWEKALSAEYYYRGLSHLKDKLEDITGNKVTDEKLGASIEALNRIKELLQQISLLRKNQPPPLGGYDFIRLNHCSFYADPDSLIKKLSDLYGELRDKKSPFPARSPRLLLAGHVVSMGDYTVPILIEDLGGVIVADSLDEGMRPYRWPVKTGGSPLENLGRTYYLERTPPSIFQPAWETRVDYFKGLVRDYDVDAVVWYQLSFEEIYDMEGSIVARAMQEMKVPFLKLESSYEYAREATGPLTTRVESFLKSIKRRGG